MATSLLLCYPDIPYNACTITEGATVDSIQGKWNLVAGERKNGFAFSAAAASNTIKFDLGAGYASKQNTANYMLVARADKLQAGSTTAVKLEYSDDDAAYSTFINATSFTSATLYGPRADDYISTSTVTTAHRYWKVTYTSSGTSKFPHSKFYFGTYFDWGKEPNNVKIERSATGGDPFLAGSGTQIGERTDEPRYLFEFTWTGVTDAKIQSFQNYFGKTFYRENGIFLYTATKHHVLDSQRLVHCRLTRAMARKIGGVTNYNEVTLAFEEMLG